MILSLSALFSYKQGRLEISKSTKVDNPKVFLNVLSYLFFIVLKERTHANNNYVVLGQSLVRSVITCINMM